MKKMKSKNIKLKTCVFIDATNIIYGASNNGWRVDFKKLAKYLKERFGAKQILYYAGVDQENLKQLKFYEKLQDFGYKLRLVPVKTFSDGKKKADVDSRMTFEMMLYLTEYNQAVVMTGDGDYYWVLEYLLETNKKVWILSFPKRTARELKQLVGADFANLENVRKIVEFRSNKNEADSTNDSASRGYGKRIAKKTKFVKSDKK